MYVYIHNAITFFLFNPLAVVFIVEPDFKYTQYHHFELKMH